MAGVAVAVPVRGNGVRARRGRQGRRIAAVAVVLGAAVIVAPLAAIVLMVAAVASSLIGAADSGSMQVVVGGTVSYSADGSTFVDIDPALNGWGGFGNGQVPEAELCALPTASAHRARCDAAEAFGRLTAAFRARFGHDIAVTDAYRSYAEQIATKTAKGFLAATPGYSNHGWGLAFDLGSGIDDYGSVQYAWMKANGYRFGFFHPTWAEPTSPDYSKSEPWHWQYVPAARVAASSGAQTEGTPDGNRAVGRERAAGRGWTGSEWACLDKLWTAESGWNHRADNPTSSAYGIPQALPGSKMADAGTDWRTNPATQITWGLGYITARYGTPCAAWEFWTSHTPHWY